MYATVSLDAHSDLKTAILSILAKRSKLGARELHGHLARDYSYELSYQAVHKAMNQLLFKNVLRKTGTKYSVSLDWLSGAQEFLSDLEDVCVRQRPLSVLELPEGAALSVSSKGAMAEPYLWVLDQARKIRTLKKPIDAVFFQHRTWPLWLLGANRLREFRDVFSDKRQCVLVQSAGLVDERFLDLWRECGFACKSGCPGVERETLVAGDFVFQFGFPASVRRRWGAVCDGFSQPDAKALLSAHRMAFEVPVEAKLLITRNADLANRIRQEAFAHF
ncbi:hypothetical protein HY994_05325 [Candidatus Micrarchaeota archaeon]|nr:hypothetical protein [Candidatus Micrarchaeota archaeon]